MEIIKNEFLHKTTVPLLVTKHETKNGNGFSTIPILMSPPGFEPGTTWLKVKCSTTWANEPYSTLISGCWLGRRDSNPRMTESKSVALPLGDSPPFKPNSWFLNQKPHKSKMCGFMVTHRRFELRTPWLKVKCSANWANESNGVEWRIRTVGLQCHKLAR